MAEPGLWGPVELALARPASEMPAAAAFPAGRLFEPKWDGFRAAAVVSQGGVVRLWSRQGRELTVGFPDIVGAVTEQVPAGTVLDGELVIWEGDRLEFDRLTARLGAGPRRAKVEAGRHPASFVVFDVLAAAGMDVRRWPLERRRDVLGVLASGWSPPLALCPATTDEAVARNWVVDLRAAGIEGVVVKAVGGRYRPGHRDWVKVKSRESVELLVGAVTGSLSRPETVVAGRFVGSRLRMVARTVPLERAAAARLAALLTAAGPGHPWPELVSSMRFGSREQVRLVRVEPLVVVEVSADAALSGGTYRHPVRWVRVRADLDASDLPTSALRETERHRAPGE